MITKVPSVLINQYHFGNKFTFFLSEFLFPYYSCRIWALENRHSMARCKEPLFRLILFTYFLKILFRNYIFHSISKISDVRFMINSCRCIHEVIHDWICYIKNFLFGHFFEIHEYSF
jgi:hypothetical protein